MDPTTPFIPGSTNMYNDLWEVYWGEDLKKDIAEFVAKCPNFQQVRDAHLKSGGSTQIIDVSTWKWEAINMDYVVGLPQTQ